MEPLWSGVTLEPLISKNQGGRLDRQTIEKLGGREGYRVKRIDRLEDDRRTVRIYLKPSAPALRQVHETIVGWVRDLPLTALQLRRVRCVQRGGPRLDKLSWLGRCGGSPIGWPRRHPSCLSPARSWPWPASSSWAGIRSRRWMKPR